MPTQEDTELQAQYDAYKALADQEVEGLRDGGRVEAIHDAVMEAAIVAATSDAGTRSKAIRSLIKDGARYRAMRLARKLPRA